MNSMQCPIDGSDLHISDKQGVEIDYCPKCRGVWLDRGELDKIIDRFDREPQSDYHHSQDRYERPHNDRYHGKKKEGFLSNIFDGFGD